VCAWLLCLGRWPSVQARVAASIRLAPTFASCVAPKHVRVTSADSGACWADDDPFGADAEATLPVGLAGIGVSGEVIERMSVVRDLERPVASARGP
jgi:hypothetical protein